MHFFILCRMQHIEQPVDYVVNQCSTVMCGSVYLIDIKRFHEIQ